MSYQESLSYLYGLQQFGIKLGLENINKLTESMGNPQCAFPIVHIAGTNGKGSTAAFLSTILKEAGLRVGLYSSPHLHSFCERIQVDGEMIEEVDVVRLTDHIRACATDIPATFFEFTTAMALDYFREEGVDISILETGMGGRLDATNVVDPVLSIITPIAMDHQQYLGDDLSTIAGEKGGIIKPGVPLLLASQPDEAGRRLLSIAEERSAPAAVMGIDFVVDELDDGFCYRGISTNFEKVRPALPGKHQYQNAGLAIAAAELLQGLNVDIPETAMVAGVESAQWPGRLEWFNGKVSILLDGAHNRQGAEALADYLESLDGPHPVWIAGFKDDKSVDDIVAALADSVSTIIVTEPPIDDALPVADVLSFLGDSIDSHTVADGSSALDLAQRIADGRHIVVAGSLFLVAEIRQLLLQEGAE